MKLGARGWAGHGDGVLTAMNSVCQKALPGAGTGSGGAIVPMRTGSILCVQIHHVYRTERSIPNSQKMARENFRVWISGNSETLCEMLQLC